MPKWDIFDKMPLKYGIKHTFLDNYKTHKVMSMTRKCHIQRTAPRGRGTEQQQQHGRKKTIKANQPALLPLAR